MDLITREQIIDAMVMAGYYWISDHQPQGALCVYKWLSTLKVSKKLQEKINGLKSDWNAVFSSEYKESDFQIPSIEYDGNDEEVRLLHIAGQIIMNTLASGNFEMGHLYLLEWSAEWSLLYSQVIAMIKKSQFKMQYVEWLLTHTFTAFDILGTNEFEIAGYKIEKIK